MHSESCGDTGDGSSMKTLFLPARARAAASKQLLRGRPFCFGAIVCAKICKICGIITSKIFAVDSAAVAVLYKCSGH